LDVDAETDLGGQVDDGLDSVQSGVDRFSIAHVAYDRVSGAGRGGMYVGSEGVEHTYIVAYPSELDLDVATDESGAASQQDPHRFEPFRVDLLGADGPPPR
jgi:hypothetical protein